MRQGPVRSLGTENAPWPTASGEWEGQFCDCKEWACSTNLHEKRALSSRMECSLANTLIGAF